MPPEVVVDRRAAQQEIGRDRLDPGPPLALNICKWAHAIVVMPFATDPAHDAVSLDMVEAMPGREALSRNRRRS